MFVFNVTGWWQASAVHQVSWRGPRLWCLYPAHLGNPALIENYSLFGHCCKVFEQHSVKAVQREGGVDPASWPLCIRYSHHAVPHSCCRASPCCCGSQPQPFCTVCWDLIGPRRALLWGIHCICRVLTQEKCCFQPCAQQSRWGQKAMRAISQLRETRIHWKKYHMKATSDKKTCIFEWDQKWIYMVMLINFSKKFFYRRNEYYLNKKCACLICLLSHQLRPPLKMIFDAQNPLSWIKALTSRGERSLRNLMSTALTMAFYCICPES